MGIGNDFSYKGASLSFLFDIKKGGIMWNGTKSRMIGFGTALVTENRGQNVTFDGVKGHIEGGQIVSSGAKNDIVATYSQYYYSTIGGGGSPSQEQFVEKTIWQIGFLKDIVANQDKFLELQQKKIVRYENLPLETATGQTINVEFVSNVYEVNNQKVIQCFIREII